MNKLRLILVFLCLSLSGFSQGVQLVKIRQMPKPGPVLYNASTIRNIGTYPLNTAGLNSFTAAASSGAFSLSVLCPCGETVIIPAGTKPPLTPPCVTNCASAPSWASSWYDYDGNLFSVRATGDDQELRFERSDGQPIALTNPNNVAIDNTKFYGHATLPGNVYQWQVYWPTAPSVKLTYKNKSTSATYVKTFTPAVGANNVNLFTASTGGGSSCDLAVAVNSPSVGCGGTANLTATASGTSATGLTYSWTGPNGYTASGASIAVAMAQSNGSYQYTVTATKTGCTASATGTVTVSGCTSTTVTPPANGVYAYRGDDFDYTPYADADQSDKFPTFENSNIYVSLALRNQLQGATQPGLGGGVYQIKNKLSANPNHVLVNVPNRYIGDDNGSPDRNRTPDFLATGQGLGECLYQSPKPFYATGESGVTTSPGSNIPGTDPGLGYNPYELGDDFNNTGRLLKFGKNGSTGFYTAMGPMAYGQDRLYLGNEVLMEKWGQVSGRSLLLHYQTTFTRPTSSRAVDKSQEAPCLYVPGNRRFIWYDGTAPYTGGGLTEIIATGSNSGNGGGLGLNGMRIGNVFPTENWIASIGENGYGVGLVFYDNIMTSYGYYGDGGADLTNPSSGGTFAYIGWNPQEVLDYNIKWRHRVKLVVGTVSEIRQEAYNDPYRPSTTPKFKFNRAGREGWIFNAGDNDNEQHTWDEGYTGSARAGWKVFFSGGGDYSASMSSPGGIWYANQFNKLYIRYKYSGQETQMELKFQRNRQKPNSTDVNYNGSGQKYATEEAIRYANGGADQDGQTVKFAVTGDGQWHTAVVDFAGLPKWTGIISRFVINPHFYVGGKTYQNGESMTIDWINNENTDPF